MDYALSRLAATLAVVLVNPSADDIRKFVDERLSATAETDEKRAKALSSSRPTLDRWRAAGDTLKVGVLRKLAEASGQPVVLRFDPPPDNKREALRPEWAEGLEAEIAAEVIRQLGTTDRIAQLQALVADLEQQLRQRGGVPRVKSASEDQDG